MFGTYRRVRRLTVRRPWLVAWAWGVLALAGILNPRGVVIEEEEATAETLRLPPSEAILVLLQRERPPGAG